MDDKDMDDEIFKSFQNPDQTTQENPASIDSAYQRMKSQEQTIINTIKKVKKKSKDPLFIASIAYALLEERENTNRILKNIMIRLNQLEEKIKSLENPKVQSTQAHGINLGETDEQIISFISKKGMICAEDLRKHMKYKRKNAASQRLTKLVSLGLLDRIQKGRKVFFRLADDHQG